VDLHDKKEKTIKELVIKNKENEILFPHSYDENYLIDGIIFSEIIGLPRAIKPYENILSQRHNKIEE